MKKRMYLGGVVALLIFAAIGVFFVRSVFAISQTSPENGYYNMRYHESGNVLKTTLAIYSNTTAKPSGASFDLKNLGSGNGSKNCDPSTNKPDIRLKITLSGTTQYDRRLNHPSCDKNQNTDGQERVYRTYAIPDAMWTQPNGDGGRWRVDLTLALSGGGSDETIFKNDAQKAWFQFRATASSGLKMTNTSNAYGSSGYETNFGVTGGNDNVWAPSNDDRTKYEIEFARPCSTGNNDTSEIAGMWDPDTFYNKIKIQQSPRSGPENWTDASINSSEGMNGGANGSGYYTPDSSPPKNGNKVSAFLRFTMKQNLKYKIVLATEVSNVVSLFWPYDSIQGDLQCNYDLIPGVTLGGQNTVDPGASVPISAPVTNTSPSAYPEAETTTRRLTKFIYDSVPTDTIARTNNAEPCASFGGAIQCSPYDNQVVHLGNSSNPASFGYNTIDDDVGKYICFVNSVSPPRDAYRRPPTWSHSAMKCVFVAKRPKVHILGSDLRVTGLNKTIGASISENIGGKTYGSWIEYGAFSVGPNSLAGSGSSFREGTTSGSNSWSQLTFSNTTSPKGNYGTGSLPVTTTVSDFDNLESTGNLGSSDISETPSGVYNVGDISINGNIKRPGKSIIIRSSGTVTINKDIIVDDGIQYNSPDDISQVVIVANNIVINRDVSRIDAWLLTRNGGLVNTCKEVGPVTSSGTAQPLVVSSCPAPLQVNGAVITDKLYLRRTGGADANTHPVAAEVFNFRASSYMWAYNFVNKQDRAQTTYVKELPPRF